MDFNLTDEQKLLQDSVDRWVRERYAFENWRKQVKSDDGWTKANWKEMAELGWLGVAIPEDFGGLGGNAIDTMVIMQSIGRGLVMEPYMATVVLGGKLIEAGGSKAQKESLLPQIADGKLQLAFAFAEHGSRYDLHDIATEAKADGAGFKLSGKKIVVYNGPQADKLIVLARTSGNRRDANGLSLFIVDNNAKGVVRRDYRTVDHRRASDISFDNVALGADALIGAKDKAAAIVAIATDHGAAAAVAESLGCMQVLHETTLAYAKTRKQFGQPIGNFQVLQHRMVDMMMACEQTHSLMLLGCLKLGADDTERAKSVSAAKAQAGRAGRFVGQQAVQIHGGMGMTDELTVGHYMKRLMMLDTFLGNADWHTRRFADMS